MSEAAGADAARPRRHKNELAESIELEMRFTNRILLQFAFIGIEAYTLDFARYALSNYKPSTTGERHFNHCLTNLPVSIAGDDLLQFGWNEQGLFRNAGVHMYEIEHMLITAALVECLPEAYVGAVLKCLADKSADKDRINPPHSSWRAFARACNGLLTPSDFALMIDDRMQLDPYRVVSGHSTSCTNSLIAPSEFANAFEALGKLTIDGSGEMTLIGGNFLAWFAAFAEYFLCINVNITARDGQALYDFKSESAAHLNLIFADDVNNLTPVKSTQDSGIITLTVMCGPDAEAKDIPRLPFTGRVTWDHSLPRVFENSFHKIAHQESKILVQSIGGAARLFQYLAEDPDAPASLISEENRSNKASLGLGLIQTICNWFPEMRHLQGRLERLQKMTREEVGEKCETGARGLISMCGCTICALVPHYSKADSGLYPQSFCLLALMETIINLGLAMSRITVFPKVYPSRSGILAMYQRQCQKLLRGKEVWLNRAKEESFARVKILFSEDWNANPSRRLQSALAVFSGSWPRDDLPENLIALSHEGMCAYMVDVQRKSSRKEDVGLIRVQSGAISWNQKSFSRLCLGRPNDLAQDDYTWEAGHCKHLAQELYFK